jgi:hypothetical protein
MTKTLHLGLPLLSVNQANKEYTINEALVLLDALLNNYALKINMIKPPLNPTNGDLYILGESPQEEWRGKSHYLAYFHQGWRYIKPNLGLDIWVKEENCLYRFYNNKWQIASQLGA